VGFWGWLRESLVPTWKSTLRTADAPTYHATGRVNAANAYAIIWKEGSFQAARFHQKSKKPMTGPSKNFVGKDKSVELKISNDEHGTRRDKKKTSRA